MDITGLIVDVFYLWLVGACVGAFALAESFGAWRASNFHASDDGFPRCGACGYDVRHATTANCSECGADLCDVARDPGIKPPIPFKFRFMFWTLLLPGLSLAGLILMLDAPYFKNWSHDSLVHGHYSYQLHFHGDHDLLGRRRLENIYLSSSGVILQWLELGQLCDGNGKPTSVAGARQFLASRGIVLPDGDLILVREHLGEWTKVDPAAIPLRTNVAGA